MNTTFKVSFLVLVIAIVRPQTVCAQTEEAFKLKHRSSFSDQFPRNPFWPIGWVKGAEPQTTAHAESQVSITPDSFSVTSISISSTPLAVINGKTYAEGEIINAIYGGQRIKILVLAIDDGAVVLQYLGKKYTIPLKRAEISSKIPAKTVVPDENAIILH